jgi:hypothetical protein
MPNEPENPKPPSMRGRPRRPDRVFKVVSYIPEQDIKDLNLMAFDDRRSRASMIQRIIKAAIDQWRADKAKQAEVIQRVAEAAKTAQERHLSKEREQGSASTGNSEQEELIKRAVRAALAAEAKRREVPGVAEIEQPPAASHKEESQMQEPLKPEEGKKD